MMKMNQLKYFVISVENGSLTTAAKILFISQPALSKQLQLLEDELECQLFIRKPTGLELTEAGRHFYNKACHILNEVELLANEMRSFTEKNTIKIASLPSIASYYIPSFLSKMNQKYKVELLIKDTTSELIDLLEHERVDFAFAQDTPAQKNILVFNLFEEPYDAIVYSPSHSDSSDVISLSELLREKLILHKHPCDIRTYFERYCGNYEMNLNIEIELEANDTIIPFVSSGLGSSIVPRMVSANIKNPLVKVKKLEQENLKRTVDFLYRPSNKKIAKEILSKIHEIETSV